MILESFEIENWTCIKRFAVSGLPATGVVVLHGPNRRGKSSAVQALRACLMDWPSNSNSQVIKSSFPRGTAEKPTVTVTFTIGGSTYRIKKCFGTSKSELAVRTSTGDWKVETASASEAHSRVCALVGGDDSSKGLRQLLWLSQAEFHLPDAKKFDADVQAQLRGILGILQTPLDDRFINCVKDRWKEWHSGQRKADKGSKLKDTCRLAENFRKLSDEQARLDECDRQFAEIEGLLRQVGALEGSKADLQRQINDHSRKLKNLEVERERSQGRIAARKLAEEQHSHAKRDLEAANVQERQYREAVERLQQSESAIEAARKAVEEAEQDARKIGEVFAHHTAACENLRVERRELERRSHRIAARLRALTDAEKLKTAKQELDRATSIATDISTIKTYLADHPAPDRTRFEFLQSNRNTYQKLLAERDAASMKLKITRAAGAAPARLTVDNSIQQTLEANAEFAVRTTATIDIAAWGQVEISRGTSKLDFAQLEADLLACEQEFSDAVAALGISRVEANTLDQIVQRMAENQAKVSELRRLEGELKRCAPSSLESLQSRVRELDAKHRNARDSDPEPGEALPSDHDELERHKAALDQHVREKDEQCRTLEMELKSIEATVNQKRAAVIRSMMECAGHEAAATSHRDALTRLPSAEQIAQRLSTAQSAVTLSERQLQQSTLSPEELTIEDRFSTCRAAVNAINDQIRDNDQKFHTIKGRLEGSENLHAQRSSLAARVHELRQLTERESLEKDAVDRLYQLFEECREKQLGTLMGPINDRVLGWMRSLDLGDYTDIKSSDSFLPEALIRRDGTAALAVNEESTGAQEQIGMLVRLALGSLLTPPNEPAVAIFDDPLTHSDVGRLNTMRAILRRAAAGDPHATPPSGPLQIIILTCHPEWFRDDHAKVIDLEDPAVMQRYAV